MGNSGGSCLVLYSLGNCRGHLFRAVGGGAGRDDLAHLVLFLAAVAEIPSASLLGRCVFCLKRLQAARLQHRRHLGQLGRLPDEASVGSCGLDCAVGYINECIHGSFAFVQEGHID